MYCICLLRWMAQAMYRLVKKKETCTVVETPIVHKSLPFGGIKFYEENRRQTGRSEDNLSSNLFFFFSFPRSSGSHNLS